MGIFDQAKKAAGSVLLAAVWDAIVARARQAQKLQTIMAENDWLSRRMAQLQRKAAAE
jgi:hypothetical protein